MINWRRLQFIGGQCLVFTSGSLAFYNDSMLDSNIWVTIIWIVLFGLGNLTSLDGIVKEIKK